MSRRYPDFVRALLLACCLFLLGSPDAAARDPDFAEVRGNWRRYQSPNFEMFSNSPDDSSRTVLYHLELLHALFLKTLHLVERHPIRVTLFFFSQENEFAVYRLPELGRKREMPAYYLSAPDHSFIVMSDAYESEQTQRIIFHEYIHHLFRVVEAEPPLWYNEGMAELFSSTEITGNGLVLGQPLPWHLSYLRERNLIPLPVLMQVDHHSEIYNEGSHTGLFYAESWALMHYLFYGRSGIPPAKVDAFLRYVCDRGEKISANELRTAFQQNFGQDFTAMGRDLSDYVRTGRYWFGTYPLPTVEPPEHYFQQPVGAGEMRTLLAGLGLRVSQAPRGKLILLQALDQNPADIRTLETLGTVAWQDGDPTRAREYWERAIQAGSDNPALFHELSQLEGRRWFDSFDFYFRLPEEKATELRSLLRRSIECAPRQSAAYELLAWVESSAHQPNIANVNLVQKHFAELKNRDRTLLALALVHHRLDDNPTAIEMLAALDRETTEANLLGCVRQARHLIEKTPEPAPARRPGKVPVPVEINVTVPPYGTAH